MKFFCFTLREFDLNTFVFFKVCERSLSGSGSGPNPASATKIIRWEMLPSGYLIRPCDGGGSIIHIVDHLNLEAWSVPEVLRPLYESSKVVAQKMTIAVSTIFFLTHFICFLLIFLALDVGIALS